MDDDKEQREGRRDDARRSDAPVDLSHERETFVRTFLRKGVELTEGVLEENKALHSKIAELEDQNARLRAQVASDDAIRDLIRKIDSLEGERNALLTKSTELEATRRESEHRNVQVEEELHDLANLYIASSHLHSTLSVRGVVQRLIELLQQLIGAEISVIYLLNAEGTTARPIGHDGVDPHLLANVVPGEGLVGEVMMTGVARIQEDVQGSAHDLANPVAVLPLLVRETPVGAIVIGRVFEQKRVWAAVDHELFKLLGSHAGTALIAANLYAEANGALAALAGLDSHLHPPS